MRWWTQDAVNQALAERSALVNALNRMNVRIEQLEDRVNQLEMRLYDDGK